MTIEEQAALYASSVGMDGWLSVDEEHNLKRMAYKESGAIYRGVADHERLVEYAQMDVDLLAAFYGYTRQRDRLAAQRPLIHNGRKMHKNGK